MIGLLVFLIFIVLPLIELLLLIYIGMHIGFWPTVAIVIITGILGGILARIQGGRAWREIMDAWREGRVPGRELVSGALFLVGSAFLLTPGVLTDLTGFLLMVPAIRRVLASRFLRVFQRRAIGKTTGQVMRIRRVE